MKRFTQSFTAIIFFFSIALLPLMAQEDVAVEKDEAVKKEETKTTVKKKTGVFTVGEIVVRDRAVANIEDATTTTEISAEDIEARSEKNLSESLGMVPGVTIEQHAKGHIRFNMRGYSMDKVALLIDGMPVTDVYESNIDISKLPVKNAAKIVVNRGVCSALYGTAGTVGSINIITKRPDRLYTDASAEYGINGDYFLNVAHGNSIGNLFYWVTGTVSHQAPYDVSQKLDKSERLSWYNKVINHDLYGELGPDLTNDVVNTYLNDTGEWPHTEMNTYNLSGKVGYELFKGLEVGVNTSYTYSNSERYMVQVDGTSSYSNEDAEWSDPYNELTANAFTWPNVHIYNISPYVSYENGKLSVRANAYYYMNDDITDAFTDKDETSAPKGWGGASSRWKNSTVGFNIFPSYKIASWNRLNGSILFRYDRHLEQEQVMDNYASLTGIATWRQNELIAVDAKYGDDWYDTKLMEGQQITLAVEDEISLFDNLQITAGISYDANNISKFEDFDGWWDGQTYEMIENDLPDDDSTIWGTNDSINPVLGVTFEPMKNFLKLRGALSVKTKLPTLATYKDFYDGTVNDIKPERSYNGNAGFEINLVGEMLVLRADYFYSRYDNKIDRIMLDSDYLYTNIDGSLTQGAEAILSGGLKNLFNLFDLSYSASYAYVDTRNLDDIDDSEINKGTLFEETPVHYASIDVRMAFVTGTNVNIWGTMTAGEIMYAMNEDLTPPADGSTDAYSTNYYKSVDLHDPIKVNIKVSQSFMEKYEVYAMCKNILDDYNADPFNPGPGRQFLFGAKAEL